ncbi:hypothetical protein [Lamprocystis purpurea]|nr:hypothetical protein [Lamprocystis purpurea]
MVALVWTGEPVRVTGRYGSALRFAPRYWMLCVFGAAQASFSEWWHRG